MKTVIKSLRKLKINDVIAEFVVKDKKLQAIPQKRLEGVKKIFNNELTAIILRKNEELKIQIKDLQPGDSIIKILGKDGRVTYQFLRQLRDYKIKFEFSVALPDEAAKINRRGNRKRVNYSQAVNRVMQLVEGAQDGVVAREKNRQLFKEFMHEARTKSPDLGVVSEISDDLLRESPETMALISLLKASDQTFAHCIDCGPIFRLFIRSIRHKYPQLKRLSNKAIYVIACLHDIGKVKVPAHLLDSSITFPRESREMQEIKKHPLFGFEILKDMNIIFENKNITIPCALVARNHHVKITNNPPSAQDKVASYPLETRYHEIDLVSKLFTPVDIYQAIIGNRSYQEVRTPPSKAMDLLDFVNIDQSIKDDFKKAIGVYPVGTPVLLNTGNHGFVISVPRDIKHMTRPEVVIFSSEGKEISHCEIIDLMEENPDKVYIKEDLDPHLDFGTDDLPKSAFEYFTNIRF
ncbi:MAG: HD domain-containing protein [Proteobacteria bacterium]|nr:HD domain-containing protein [Pseudomonadota bacterium]